MQWWISTEKSKEKKEKFTTILVVFSQILTNFVPFYKIKPKEEKRKKKIRSTFISLASIA